MGAFAGDLAKRRRAKFVPGESAVRVHQTKEPEHKQDFDEWLARIICYAFGMIRKSGDRFSDKIMPLKLRASIASSEAIALYGRRNGR